MERRPLRLAAALAALAALVLAGCGGSGGERLTKDEYIAGADAICKEANADIAALGEPETIEDVAALADDAVAISEDQLERLRALSAPEADEALLNEAYDLLEQQLDVARGIGEAAKDGDLAAAERLVEEATPIRDRARRIAREYGMKECGSGD